MNVFQFIIICKRTNNANNATHYVKLGKKRRESSKRNYYIISPRVIIKAIIIIVRPQLLVSKNPEKPKKISVDLTGLTYDGRCKRLVTIDVLVFVVLDIGSGL